MNDLKDFFANSWKKRKKRWKNSSASIRKVIQYFISGWMYRIFLLLALVSFIVGGISITLLASTRSSIKGLQDSVLETARSQNYKDEKLEVTETGKTKRTYELTYDSSYNPIVTHDGKSYLLKNSKSYEIDSNKNELKEVPKTPYLDASYVFLSLINKDLGQDFTSGTYNVLENLNKTDFKVQNVTYGTNEAPSYYVSGTVKKGDVFFFKKKMYELVDATVPNDVKEFKVELVINKRLAIINEIKITGLEKEGYTLYLKYIR